MSIFERVLFIVFLLGLAACQQSTSSPTRQPPSDYEHPCVTLQLEAPTEVTTDETVTFTLTAKNTCNQVVNLNLNGNPPYEIILAQEDGSTVWIWPPPDGGRDDILLQETLEPQGELVYAQEWSVEDNDEKPMASGTYQVYGVLLLSGGEREENRQLVSEVETLNVGS